ncbi:hypothetical protein ACROYT_G034491 [Oculina patagonica]
MAEFAAHLNQGTTNANPTIFEIVAEESMASVLRPAVSYALKVLATSNPDRWGWIWRFGDELHLCLDYIVQNYYLKNFGGSISEHFYGLKRVNRKGEFPSFQKYLSLIMLVGIPYAKLKLDQLFERVREEYVSGYLFTNSSRKRSYFLHLKRTFIYVYPFLHFTWETIFLCYHLLYVFRFSGVHSPLLHVIGVSLQRLTRQDILAHSMHNSLLSILSGKTVAQRMAAIPSSVMQLLTSLLANGLPVVVFFLKFIDWWYSSDNKGAVQSVMQLPVPPPPPQPKPAQHGAQLPPHPAQCPLCKKVRTNPTALASSGYVFCYPYFMWTIKTKKNCFALVLESTTCVNANY